MPLVKSFVNPFDINGVYEGFQETTSSTDFSALANLVQNLDDDEFDIGVFKFDQSRITFRNEDGRFSDVNVDTSIFNFKRQDSQVKFSWRQSALPSTAGLAVAGNAILGNTDIEVFKGLIEDSATNQSVINQKTSFRLVGFEAIFARAETPFASISDGQSVSTILLAILNQTKITDLLTVNALNLNPNNDVLVDDVSSLENTTVKEALDELLFVSNSVLFIKNDTIFVSDRTESAELKQTFIGQASPSGIEDIQGIENFKNGLNQTFNLWTWIDTVLDARNSGSIATNGVRKKEIDSDLITNNTTRQSILDSYLAEFDVPKEIFDLIVPITRASLDLFMLDKVKVDYPTVFQPAGGSIRTYGIAIYGVDLYPFEEFGITISVDNDYKIMGRTMFLKDQNIKFKLRKV